MALLCATWRPGHTCLYSVIDIAPPPFFSFGVRDEGILFFYPFTMPAIMCWVSQGVFSCWEQKFTINHTKKWNVLEGTGVRWRRQEQGLPKLWTQDDFDHMNWFSWLLILLLCLSTSPFTAWSIFICLFVHEPGMTHPVHATTETNTYAPPVSIPRSQEVNPDWCSVGHVLPFGPISCWRRSRLMHLTHSLRRRADGLATSEEQFGSFSKC